MITTMIMITLTIWKQPQHLDQNQVPEQPQHLDQDQILEQQHLDLVLEDLFLEDLVLEDQVQVQDLDQIQDLLGMFQRCYEFRDCKQAVL